MKIYSKEEWDRKQHTGQWADNPWNRSRVEAGELHPYYIGRRYVMVNEGKGPCLITEGVHFLIDGDYSTLPVLNKENAMVGAAYQFAGGVTFVKEIYRLSEEQARREGCMYLDRVKTSDGDYAIPGSDIFRG